MNKIKFILLIAASLIPLTIYGAGTSIDTQGVLLGTTAENKSAKVDIEIAISLPDYPKIGPIIFSGSADVSYSINEKNILLLTEQFSELYAELTDIPESYRPVTLALNISNSAIKSTWDKDRNITISPVDFEVSVYKGKTAEIENGARCLTSFTLKNVQILFEDMISGNILLNFDANLPRSGNEFFDQILSGKEIHGDITINY